VILEQAPAPLPGRRRSSSSIVAAVVGEADARHYSALLFSSAHGIAGLEISGHLTEEKWHTTAEDLIATLVVLTVDHHPAARTT
jgi:hypothetical protein